MALLFVASLNEGSFDAHALVQILERSPYQQKRIRVLEFPSRRFAQSFPNTVPYSERIGFIENLTDDEDIDYIFYVTAHEVAPMMRRQVVGAFVQGIGLMPETMAQYSALMVMAKSLVRKR